MRLIQLQYFVEIVRQQSFTRAAEKLYVSQPALSKSVRMLEQEFKVDLINRTEKSFVLTKSGQLFFDYAQRILETVELQTHELNQRLHGLEGSLRIGIPPPLAPSTITLSSATSARRIPTLICIF